MTTFCTANFGRAKSAAPVRASMDAVEHGLSKFGDAVLCAQEIDEGDKTHPTDHELLAAIFAKWHVAGTKTREPILTHASVNVMSYKSYPCAKGVPHQSPARSIQEVILVPEKPGDPQVVVLNGHYPAGAHNGTRSPKAKAALLRGYVSMLRVHRRLLRTHAKAGRHVVWGCDTNWRNFPPLNRAEVPVLHVGPDYIRCVPAKGYRAHVGKVGKIPMSIEPGLHDCHHASITFTKGK